MWIPNYADRRPTTPLRMNAQDHGIVLKHGDGPNRCDFYGARDPWIFEQSHQPRWRELHQSRPTVAIGTTSTAMSVSPGWT